MKLVRLPDGCRNRERVLHAPQLIDLGVLSVMRRRAATGGLGQRRADLALGDLVDLPMIRHPHLPFVRRVWELREEVTPYDAAYIALAETLGIPFVTADRGLATASGIRCAIEVLGKS